METSSSENVRGSRAPASRRTPPAAPPDATLAGDAKRLRNHVGAASRFLKALSNQHRLLILCHLTDGEKSVGELEERLGIQQAHLSQQLGQLRREGLVETRRESRLIYYSLGSASVHEMIRTLHHLFCLEGTAKRQT